MASQTDVQVLESLRLLRDSWITAYAASLTAVSSGLRPSYSVGGQSVSWESVYTSAPKVIDDLTERINKMSWQGGHVESYVRP